MEQDSLRSGHHYALSLRLLVSRTSENFLLPIVCSGRLMDGAVGLLGVLSAKQMRARRIIAMSRPRVSPEARTRICRYRHCESARG
jgi:hypothetical protein